MSTPLRADRVVLASVTYRGVTLMLIRTATGDFAIETTDDRASWSFVRYNAEQEAWLTYLERAQRLVTAVLL